MSCVLIQKREVDRDRKQCKDTQGNWSDASTSKKHLRLPETRRGQKQILPWRLRRENGLVNTSVLTSSVRNSETIDVCSSEPCVWYFVTAALETSIALFISLLKSCVDGEWEWANTHESIFSHFNALSPFFRKYSNNQRCLFFFYFTGLNSTLVSNCRGCFLISTSYYCLEKKHKQAALL